MGGIQLFSGNRLEVLAEKLSEVLSVPLADPFTPEVIVVQSSGMEHWLSMQLARFHGICSNMRFPFPSAMIRHLFSLLQARELEGSLFAEATMGFRIMGLLPGLSKTAGFEALQSYLQTDPKGVRLFQLSMKLAEMFDNYVMFRHEMIHAWEEGRPVMPEEYADTETWQMALWKELSRGHELEHGAALKQRFIKALNEVPRSKLRGIENPFNSSPLTCVLSPRGEDNRVTPPQAAGYHLNAGPDTFTPASPGSTVGCSVGLPERISLFGISYLPPFYLDVFDALAERIEVNFFLLNPCRQYWGDIRSKAEIARMAGPAAADSPDLFFEEGNSLLAAMGSTSRDLFDMLLDRGTLEADVFRDIEGSTLLEKVQADILDLKEPGTAIEPTGVDDISIQVHSCHSPMREVEVLKDNLLNLFDRLEDLRPEEILIMAPDIEAYTPFIRAVFEGEAGKARVPYRIVDRSLKSASTLADTLLSLFDLGRGRFEASRVLALLESAQVRKRFNLKEEDTAMLERWAHETGIRWGIDGSWKETLGLPATHENTWAFGIERLLLGYAMDSEGTRPFASILAFDDMEPDSAEALGSFVTFLTKVFSWVKTLTERHGLKDWPTLLNRMLDELFDLNDESSAEERRLRTIFGKLADVHAHSGVDLDLHGDVVRLYVMQETGKIAEGRNFLSGGITFCEMLPMRSVPFRVIGILGLNHSSFPRQHSPKGFDLMAKRPRKGDHNRRNQDLMLFLEALISAREVLLLSYVGQSMRDNSAIPPSVAVSTLLEYLDAYRVEDGQSVSETVMRRHCLQAFNPRYFMEDSSLFSYSEENARAAVSLLKQERRETEFMPSRLAEPAEEWRTVDVGRLSSFFANPCRFLLEKKIGLSLSTQTPFLIDMEPVDLNRLELYRMRDDLVALDLAGMDRDKMYNVLRMRGLLPHSKPGEALYERVRQEAGALADEVRRCISGPEATTRVVDLSLGPFMLTGSLLTQGPDRLVFYRTGKDKASFLVQAWIAHLTLCAMGQPAETFCITLDGTDELTRVDNSQEVLSSLMDLYWEGLMRPLPFFPQTSFAYASSDKPREERLVKARIDWLGGEFKPGEGEDRHMSLCFKAGDALSPEFEDLAMTVYGPLLNDRRRAGR